MRISDWSSDVCSSDLPDVLQPETRPVPRPGPGAVLIRVAAAGVNRPAVLQRMGFYPPPPGASDLPGLELAGVIAAVGQLGRASCRASWCQCVLSLCVAGSVKKK